MTVDPAARTFVDDRGRRWAFHPRDQTSDNIVLDESWKHNGYRMPPSDGQSLAGQIVVDVGANIGAFTTRALATGATVVAVEPMSSNVARLRHHLELNQHLQRGGWPVHVKHAAVTGDGRDVEMTDHYSGGSHMTTIDEQATEVVRSFTLHGLIDETLDQFDAGDIAVLKIDVEGAEYEQVAALPVGALDRIERFAIEFHQWVVDTPPAYLAQPAGSFGALVEKLTETHRVSILGRASIGGTIFGERH